jgi:O-antigen/teichoic acid export membrane protein
VNFGVSLRSNIIANYLGQGWTALIGLAFVPLYIEYLGIEAYGLIGIFALLQAWLSLLDMGMTPTLNREMARFTAGAHTPQSIRDLLRSLEIICFAIAALIGMLIWGASGWLAADWLRADKLPLDVVAQAIAIMGGVAALRFVEGIYRGAILGLQRQVFFNAVNAALSTVRAAGALAMLAWVSPTIEVYFVWQGMVSVVSIVVLAVTAHRSLPTTPQPARFSQQALMDIRHFAGGMMATTFLALMLTQVDKILLSRLLSLEAFGSYSLASLVVGSLSVLSVPIAQAYYPRMTELVTRKDEVGLVTVYHRSAQIITVLVGTASVMLILFGERLLIVWANNPGLAHEVAPVMAVLTVGTLLNNLMIMPYMLQLAHGWSSFAAKINMVAVTVLVPTILWVGPRYGAMGVAWVWVALNSGYVLIAIHLMHRRLIPHEKWHWYGLDIAGPLAAILAAAGVFRYWQPLGLSKFLELSWLGFVGVTIALAAALAAPELWYSMVKKMKVKMIHA